MWWRPRKGRCHAGLEAVRLGLGGVAYLSLENRLAGALFFTVGLFTICTFGFHLFTGKVCYVFQKGGTDPRHLPLIWLGNLAGTGAVAAAGRLTRPGARGRPGGKGRRTLPG